MTTGLTLNSSHVVQYNANLDGAGGARKMIMATGSCTCWGCDEVGRRMFHGVTFGGAVVDRKHRLVHVV